VFVFLCVLCGEGASRGGHRSGRPLVASARAPQNCRAPPAAQARTRAVPESSGRKPSPSPQRPGIDAGEQFAQLGIKHVVSRLRIEDENYQICALVGCYV